MTFPEFLEALRRVKGKAILRRYFNEDSCINTTRVLLECAWRLGVEPRPEPVVVTVMVFSPKLVAWVEKHDRAPTVEERERLALHDPRYHSIGLGFGGGLSQDPAKWPGHLAIRCGDELLDATIAQVARPKQGIDAPDMLNFTASVPAFWAGETPANVHPPNGSLFIYRVLSRHNSYMVTPGWNLRPDIEQPIAEEILRNIQAVRGAS